MKYLVLGSKGQIGSHLSSYLVEQGHTVQTFDYTDSIYQDLRIQDSTLLHNYMNQCDFVYFLAFDVGGSRYLKNYQFTKDFIDNNLDIMRNTFQLLDEHSKPFIFTSSQMSNMTHSPYGTLKKLGEFYTDAIGGINVKFWNVFGIENDREKSHVITDLILKGIKNHKIDLLTNGKEKRQMLYVKDCSRALFTLSQKYNQIKDRLNKPVLDITNFKWNTIGEIAYTISKYMDNIPVNFSNNGDDVQKEQYNEPSADILDYWQPLHTLEDGIKEMVDYYVKSHW
jgi:nucleoside-diphosphate-sugar epimerase